jgi:hypothetical protein
MKRLLTIPKFDDTRGDSIVRVERETVSRRATRDVQLNLPLEETSE